MDSAPLSQKALAAEHALLLASKRHFEERLRTLKVRLPHRPPGMPHR